MKLGKIQKILPGWERIRVWGNDENIPLYDGSVEDLPHRLDNLKMIRPADTDSYIEVRYHCSDIDDHVAVFVQED